MFKRLTIDDLQTLMTILALVAMFGFFVYISIRALYMKKDDLEESAQIPLHDQSGERIAK